MLLASPLSVADRFALILDGLARAVAARIAPRGSSGAMAAAMIVLVWTRVKRIDREIQGLLARFRAGRLLVVAAPRMGQGRGGVRPAAARLPVRFAWLLAYVPCDAACFAGQLGVVLAEPEMVALLEASPQARRVLAPLCRMLGMDRSLLRAPAPIRRERLSAAVMDQEEPGRDKPVRDARGPAEFGRIALPRGVLSAARRQGFGKR